MREAAAIWEKLVDVAPDRAYLAFDRLEALAVRAGSPERFTRLCRQLIDDNPQDWRARLALSRHLAASGRPHEALDLLFAALVQNPHALGIHQAIWRALGATPSRTGAGGSLQRAHPRTPSSTWIPTSACAAAIAAPSCSGSARTATIGIRSSRNGSRRRRTRPRWRLSDSGLRAQEPAAQRATTSTGLEPPKAVLTSLSATLEDRSTCRSVSSRLPSVRIT